MNTYEKIIICPKCGMESCEDELLVGGICIECIIKRERKREEKNSKLNAPPFKRDRTATEKHP